MKPSVPLILRIQFLSAVALALNACSNTKPEDIRGQPLGYTPSPQFETTPPQSLSRLPFRENPPQNLYRPQFRSTQPPSFDRPATYSNKPATYSGIFLKPRELEPAVEFWRKVYVEWPQSNVVFHDDRHLDVIYEVMTLPGYVDDSLTEVQKDMVKRRREFWKAQLAMLESKWRYRAPLNAYEQQIIDKLKKSGKPLERFLNGASERVHSQRGIRERFKRGLAISERYDRRFRKIFRDAGLPEDLACLPHVESSFQPAARSSAGAVGMWQFTRAAAKRFMPYSKRVDRRLDPFASAVGAANYLSYAYEKLGNWPAAITSYNHGISGMMRAQDQVGRDFARIVQNYSGPSFGFASRNYYAQFLAAREIARNPTRYFPDRLSELARQ